MLILADLTVANFAYFYSNGCVFPPGQVILQELVTFCDFYLAGLQKNYFATLNWRNMAELHLSEKNLSLGNNNFQIHQFYGQFCAPISKE